MRKILIVTDAWSPQVNGVVRTLQSVRAEHERTGAMVEVISPDMFNGFPCPTYPEIKLAFLPGRKIARTLAAFQPDAIHIATEGPLGHAARGHCLAQGLPFTTAYHTRFPEYVEARFAVPVGLSYAWLRRFHRRSRSIMVATQSIESDLLARGFGNIRRWSRGVDTNLFKPRDKNLLKLPRPIHLFVGRVAVEKNIEAFLSLDLPGSQVVIGDGPQLEQLKRKFPKAYFLGKKVGEDLARHYAAADVFVFPSLTDTFGLVILEALASGLPVAAFPVTGPRDVIGDAPVGALDNDLRTAALKALEISPAASRAFACAQSWRTSAEQFLAAVVPFNKPFAKQPRTTRLASIRARRKAL